MKLELSKLNTRQLVELGDAAAQSELHGLARELYARVATLVPSASHVLSRLGMATNPSARTAKMVKALQAVEEVRPVNVFMADGMATWLKTLPFMEDPRFLALAQKHSALLPVANWHWNLQTVLWAVQQVREVEGDFVELGVFKGHTTHFVAEYVGFADWARTWWLYDTFEGIPADQMERGWEANNRSVYVGTFSHDEVRASFAAYPNIEVIKGRVPEILHEKTPEKVAFLHMDLNNAPAEIAALDLLFDRLAPGGVIVFDDYLWAVSKKQYDAEKAWFAAKGLVILPVPTGQGVFIKR